MMGETKMRLDSRSALLCHEYLHKTYAPLRFDLSGRREEDPLLREFKLLGKAHEDRVIGFILGLSLEIANIGVAQSRENREIATAHALVSPTVQIIIGSRIGEICEREIARLRGIESVGDPSRISRPDLLIRVGQDSLGTPLWAPVDIKSHSAFDSSNKSNAVKLTPWDSFHPSAGQDATGRMSLEDSFQLAHYLEHLQNLGLANLDSWAGIVGSNFDEIVWAKLHDVKFGVGAKAQTALTAYRIAFLEAEQLIQKSIVRNLDENLPLPSIAQMFTGKFGCSTCDFKDVCKEEMLSYDSGAGHVTLLATVTPDKAAASLGGIQSISTLVRASGLNDFGSKAIIRAQVWLDNSPRLLISNEPLGLPEFDVEVDIDLENSQEALLEIAEGESLGRDQVYLYGYGVLDRNISQDWQSASFDSFADYSDTPDGELRVLLAMWNKLTELVSAAKTSGKSIGVFHYSSHERTWWRNFGRRYAGEVGVPTQAEIDSFVSAHFVDLLPYARKVSFPTTDYSIKSLAPLAGFKWEVKEAGGATSLLKYKTAISKASTESDRTEAIEWLRSYNLDDVRATFAVRAYLRGLDL